MIARVATYFGGAGNIAAPIYILGEEKSAILPLRG